MFSVLATKDRKSPPDNGRLRKPSWLGPIERELGLESARLQTFTTPTSHWKFARFTALYAIEELQGSASRAFCKSTSVLLADLKTRIEQDLAGYRQTFAEYNSIVFQSNLAIERIARVHSDMGREFTLEFLALNAGSNFATALAVSTRWYLDWGVGLNMEAGLKHAVNFIKIELEGDADFSINQILRNAANPTEYFNREPNRLI